MPPRRSRSAPRRHGDGGSGSGWPPSPPSPSASESLPPAIAQVAGQVEAERGLRFRRPVSPEPVSHQRLVELLQAGLNQEYPADMEQRKGRAWATIGAVPPGTDLRQAIL